MGLFRGIKNIYKKSEAAVVIQILLEELKGMGLFDSDPAKVANKLVEAAWDSHPEMFNGTHGERPHKLALAAYSFAYVINKLERDNQTRATLQIPFGQLMLEILKNGKAYPFNELDHILLDSATGLFHQLIVETNSDPLIHELEGAPLS